MTVPPADGLETPTRRAGAFGVMRSRARPAATDPSARSSLRPTLSLLRGAAADAQRSRLPQMAAALAYRTIFALIPMAVVALVVLRAFATDEDVERALTDALHFTGLDRIVIDEPAAPEEPVPWTWLGPSPMPVPDAAGADSTAIAPSGSPAGSPPTTGGQPTRLDRLLRELVGRASDLNIRVISWVGVAMLIYAALSMLIEVERAFNQIYRVPIGRSWVRRIMQYWTLLTLGSLFLAATFWVGEQFKAGMIRIMTYGDADGGGALLVGAIGFATTVAISTLLLLLVYMAVPNTKVRFGAALAGALLAAILWESGKWAFTQYLHYATTYARLYGSLALVPLFLLWVYVTWVIVLFGLYVAYQIQHIRANTVARPEFDASPAVVDPLAIISVAALLAQRFAEGRTAAPQEVARQLNIAAPIAHQMLDRLAEAQIAHRVSSPDAKPLYALSRPPERIAADEVLRLGEALAGEEQATAQAAREGGPAAAISSLRLARHQLVRGKTLADLLASPDRPPPPAPPEPPREPTRPTRSEPAPAG